MSTHPFAPTLKNLRDSRNKDATEMKKVLDAAITLSKVYKNQMERLKMIIKELNHQESVPSIVLTYPQKKHVHIENFVVAECNLNQTMVDRLTAVFKIKGIELKELLDTIEETLDLHGLNSEDL
ncbi:MAG TPA: hypothetical protein P5292_04180 [Bacteroidia bacterium]|nr:hypothetical protein [Bacteroidia bacterium]